MYLTAFKVLTNPVGSTGPVSREELLTFVRRPRVSDAKDTLPGFALATFDDNRRALECVREVFAVVLDDDKSGLDVEATAVAWASFAGVVFSTYSSTPERPRTRTILYVSRPMTGQEYARVWRHVRDLAKARGVVLDEQTKDASRFWYVPAVRTDATYACAELGGEPLDVDAALAATPHDAPVLERTPASSNVSARHKAAAQALGAAWPETGRHEAQLALAGALRREGYDADTALEVLCAVCAAAGDEDRPKREATIRATYAKPLDAAITGWSRLAAHIDPGVVDAARALVSPHADGARALEADFAAMSVTATTAESPGDLLTKATASDETPAFRAPNYGAWDEIIAPPVYLLDGLIPESTVVCFFAEGGSVKSWTALGLAHAVATGQDFLGRRVLQGPAVILDYEDGRYEYQRRAGILGFNGPVPELGYVSHPGSLADVRFWEGLARHVVEHDVRFVVVDALSSGMPGDADENSSDFVAGLKLAGKLVSGLQDAKRPLNILFVHHANKSGSMRGFSGIRDQCDVVFRFEPVSEDEEAGLKRMRMVCDKPGPQRKPLPVNVELSDAGLKTFVDAPKPAVSGVDDVAGRIRLVLATKGPVRTTDKLRSLVGARKEVLTADLAELIAAGEVVRIEKQGYVLDTPEARRARLLALVGQRLPSRTALAKAAHLRSEDIADAERQGLVVSSGEGMWIVLDPS